MVAKGQITRKPRKGLRLLVTAQLVWLALVCVLGGWWGTLVSRQAYRIAELESAQGVSASVALSNRQRTERMIYGESATFFALLLASTGFLFWLYWRDSMRSRGIEAFFASVTHELRTPLTSIRLQAESIADSLPDSGNPAYEEQRKLIERLLEDSSRLESQVERTLELARLEGGGPLFPQPIPLAAWVERATAGWTTPATTRKFGTVAEISSIRGQAVLADPAALEIILKNLLENSLRHSDKDPVEIRLTAERSPGWVVLNFSDNGERFSGDPARLGALFQKGRDSKGAGVGLYLVKALMARMEGEACFSAPPGSGLKVSLRFKEAEGSSA